MKLSSYFPCFSLSHEDPPPASARTGRKQSDFHRQGPAGVRSDAGKTPILVTPAARTRAAKAAKERVDALCDHLHNGRIAAARKAYEALMREGGSDMRADAAMTGIEHWQPDWSFLHQLGELYAKSPNRTMVLSLALCGPARMTRDLEIKVFDSFLYVRAESKKHVGYSDLLAQICAIGPQGPTRGFVRFGIRDMNCDVHGETSDANIKGTCRALVDLLRRGCALVDGGHASPARLEQLCQRFACADQSVESLAAWLQAYILTPSEDPALVPDCKTGDALEKVVAEHARTFMNACTLRSAPAAASGRSVRLSEIDVAKVQDSPAFAMHFTPVKLRDYCEKSGHFAPFTSDEISDALREVDWMF